MTKIVYEVVEHDGGWAYKVDGVFSETFPSDDKARAAAERAEDARSRRSPLRSPRISPSWSSPFASIRDQLSYSKELAANEAYAANMGKHCFKWTSLVSEKSRWATGRRNQPSRTAPHFRFSTVCKCSGPERLAHRRRCRALGHQNLVFVPACRRKASRRTAVRSG
jgi:hypothetical protein